MLSRCENFLWARPPNGGLYGRDMALSKKCRCGIPRLADAIALDRAAAQGVEHQRRRHNDDLDIARRVDAAGRQPIAKLVVMSRVGVDDSEPQRRLVLIIPRAKDFPQRAAVRCGFEVVLG